MRAIGKKLYLFAAAAVLLCAAMLFAAFAGTAVFVQAADATEYYDYALTYKHYSIKDYTEGVTVTDPRGESVAVEEGGFTPVRSGVYTLRFGTEDRYLRVFAALPAVSFSFDSALDPEYGVGEYISLPDVQITSEIETDGDYTVYIECDGAVADVIESGEDLVFRPMSAGEYAAVYSYTDYFGYSSNRTLEFSVAEKPVISFDPPETLAYGSTVQPGQAFACNGGETVQAQLRVTAPSGKEVDISTGSFVADEIGNYIYTVTAEIGGQSLEKQYTVRCDLFNRYLFDAVRLANDPVSQVPLPDTCAETGSGILLEGTASGAVFEYSQIINLNDVSDKYILTFFPYVTDKIGYMETLEITLTDIYDPYNEISVYFKRSPFHDDLTYVTAAHNERHYAYDNENFVLTGENGPVKIGDKYFFGGLMRDHYSMMGVSDEKLALYSFSMNYAERQMVLDLSAAGEGERFVLMDFDNPVWCGGEQYTWNGFTTGEVYMTLEFGTITGDSAAIIVTDVMGQSVGSDVTEDSDAPSIVVDTDEDYLSDMPFGVVGSGYEIPQASAYDAVSGAADVNIRVLRGDTQVFSGSGTFVPDAAGDYVIEYTAQDVRGNEAKKELAFTVYASAPEIVVSMNETQDPVPGKYYAVPDFTVENASGKYETDVKIVYNGEEVTSDSAGKIYIDAIGTIKFTVTVTDWLGRTAEKTFEVAVSTDDVRMTIPYAQTVAVPGQVLEFEPPLLSDFNGKDEAEIAVEIYVNGARIEGESYTVQTGDVGILTVEYVVKVNGAEAVRSGYEVAVSAQSGSLTDAAAKVESLFATQNAEVAFVGEESEEVHFRFAQDGYFELRTPVSHNQLRISLSVPAYDFESIDVYLTDVNDPDISVFLRITDYDLSSARLQLNGTGDYYIISGSVSRPGMPITFLYDCDRLNFKRAVSESEIFSIGSTAGGDVFNGFTGSAVRIRVQVNGVKNGTAQIRLQEVSNESFMTYLMTGVDSIAPVVSVPFEQDVQRAEYGSEFTVSPAKAFDVLAGIFDAAVTVRTPAGETLVSGQVLTEAYTFTLSEYGRYTISYSVSSAYTMSVTKEIYIDVLDEIAPEITVKGEVPATAALGDWLTVAGMTATDNYTSEPDTRIFIYDPDYRNRIVSEGEKYRFTLRGTYKVVYYAADEAGNVSRVTYTIEVE